jgi:polygalacturonase
MNRRNLIQLLGTAGIAPASLALGSIPQSPEPFQHLLRPQSFGAKVDGLTLDSPAINAAIDRANAQGGGIVYLSPGVYLCGTVVLKSNVTLHLEAGAVILGTTDLTKYEAQISTPTAPGTRPTSQGHHLIFARDAENITLSGAGLIDGQGPKLWVKSTTDIPAAPDQHWADVVSVHYHHVPGEVSPLLEFDNCKHLRIEQVRIENASGWTLRTLSCTYVVIDGVFIKNPVIGPNTDGMDITSSSDVHIANCSIDTGDDAICLKSENPYGGEVSVMRNVTVTNCTLATCCNGFKFGTATKGGYENIMFTNSTIWNPADSDLAARVISGIGIEMVDGGYVDGVVISNIRMQRTRTPIFIRLGARKAPLPGAKTFLRGVMISDIHATEAVLTNSITGLPGLEVEDVTLSNIHIETQEPGLRSMTDRAIPDKPNAYPEARMFGTLPAYGMYIRHARGVRMHNAVFTTLATEQRPAIVADDVANLEISALRVPAQGNQSPVIDLRQTRDAWIRDCTTGTDAPSLLQVSGADSARILISGCNLLNAKQPVTLSANATPAAVSLANNITHETTTHPTS